MMLNVLFIHSLEDCDSESMLSTDSSPFPLMIHYDVWMLYSDDITLLGSELSEIPSSMSSENERLRDDAIIITSADQLRAESLCGMTLSIGHYAG